MIAVALPDAGIGPVVESWRTRTKGPDHPGL